MYFGEFIIEKGIVNQEQVLSALMKQIETVPSACEIVYKNNLLNKDQVYQAINYQSKNKMGFVEACKKLDYWNEDVEKQVVTLVNKSRPPLGQILVSDGCVDLETLTKALDEFLSQVEAQSETAESKPHEAPSPEPVDSTPTPTSIEDAPKEAPAEAPEKSSDEFRKLDSGLVEDFLQLFESEKIDMILEKMNQLDQGDFLEKLKENLTPVVDEVHRLKGFAQFLKLQKNVQILTESEEILADLLQTSSPPSAETANKVKDAILAAMGIVSELKESVKQNLTEENYFKEEANAKKYQVTLDQLAVVKFDLSLL